jgi:uncharacterized protein with HEPN domain
MSKFPEEYLNHILDETKYLIETTNDLKEEEFSRNETLQKAFVRSLEIIGEAIKNLPKDFRENHEEIDWKTLAGMRDRLIHGYFGVDYEIVWDVVKNEIPILKQQIQGILKTAI